MKRPALAPNENQTETCTLGVLLEQLEVDALGFELLPGFAPRFQPLLPASFRIFSSASSHASTLILRPHARKILIEYLGRPLFRAAAAFFSHLFKRQVRVGSQGVDLLVCLGALAPTITFPPALELRFVRKEFFR